MKLPNCLPANMLRAVLITALCSTFFIACKKDTNDPFKKYAGNWKPTRFWKWDGLKQASFPTGTYYMQWNDKMIYIEMEFRADTVIDGTDTIIRTNVSKEKYRDTCDFTYSITTTVNNDNLTLDEHYVLYKKGAPYKKLDYGFTMQMKEGRTDYSLDQNHTTKIYTDSMLFSEYYWSGMTAWNSSRKLVKK